MATKPTAAIDRLQAANNNPYDADTNPSGLAEGGHRQNWIPNAAAEIAVAEWAAASAAEADADASAADTSRQQAATSATSAADSADDAASSATDAANSAARLQGTSATSIIPAIATRSFVTQAGKAFDVGAFVAIQSRGTATRRMFGKVTAYSGTSLSVAVQDIGSTVTAGTDWNILVSGAQGVQGVQGPMGDPNTAVIYGLNLHYGS